MQDVIWSDRPTLRKPVMVCAFNGWNDAGEAASAAVSFIRGSFDAEEVASIDPEEFFDFTAVRPTVRLTEGVTREIDWPVGDDLGRRRPRRRGRPGDAPGDRAVAALAPLHGEPGRDRARAGRAHGDHARRAAGRRAAHAAGGDHRPRLGALAGRPARLPAHELRGAHRHRRRAAQHAAPGPASRRRACGRRCPTTWPPRPTRRSRSPWCARSRESRAWSSTRASWRAPPRTTSARSAPPWPPTRRSRRSSSAWRPPWTRSSADTPDEQDIPSADTIARDFQRFLRQRGPNGPDDR